MSSALGSRFEDVTNRIFERDRARRPSQPVAPALSAQRHPPLPMGPPPRYLISGAVDPPRRPQRVGESKLSFRMEAAAEAFWHSRAVRIRIPCRNESVVVPPPPPKELTEDNFPAFVRFMRRRPYRLDLLGNALDIPLEERQALANPFKVMDWSSRDFLAVQALIASPPPPPPPSDVITC